MATSCGLPGCPSKVSNNNNQQQTKGSQGTGRSPFKGPCGLPDCRNEAAAGSRRPNPNQKQKEQGSKLCDVPGCRDEAARKEVNNVLCLYRGPGGNNRTSSCPLCARVGAAYQLCAQTWKKIRSNPYYWSLFKSITFFVLGLKLFNDIAGGKSGGGAASACKKRKKA